MSVLLIPLHGDIILEDVAGQLGLVAPGERARMVLEARARDLDTAKPYVQFEIEVDGEPGGAVGFLAIHPTPASMMNVRAREALLFLTGVHMVIPGDCAFIGLDPVMVDAIVAG